MTRPESWRDMAEMRQALYRFFGSALLEPSVDRLQGLAVAAAYLDMLGLDSFAYAGVWHTVSDSLRSGPSPELLAGEYVRLFASGVDGALSPPTESFYAGRADTGGVGETVAAVERDYRALGVMPRPAGTVAADHVSTELEAMAALCRWEAEAWKTGDRSAVTANLQDQDRFLGSHLTRWLPEFRRRVEAAGAIDYYRQVVTATVDIVRHDRDYVRALLGRMAEVGV